MKIRFLAAGALLLLVDALLFLIRGVRPNFFIPMAVGLMLLIYGIVTR
ncbi:hypothetical protein GCM10007108_05580 [Thermogymnomonas acidicola]|uniref:Uncharacterized protein n=1 Tax=Thermogymnomonas acidicola TaxID=399579 RepID=A0AA37BQS0_9ARCH|nr:hypothetical protein [Thermogymnomonas acidicola]GGM70379.1 hypothetical protein GCM10007108_05580 [Thermogymnomonas acidicola]